jgi:ribosomal protein S18 acetylase RimI-like enzyme
MLTIRPAVAADASAVAAVVHDAYVKYVARIGKPPGPMLDDYAARVATGQVWVCDEGNAIAGILVLEPEPDHLLLDNIAVAPAWQGRGVGRMLLDFADAEALRTGLGELRLYTHVLMQENIALYSRLGWQEYARGEQAGFQRVFMRKRVGSVTASTQP